MNGLRSAPLAWYQELSGHLKDLGFSGGVDPTIFRKGTFGRDLLIVLFYVDDLLIWCELKGVAEKVFQELARKYKLKRTGFY